MVPTIIAPRSTTSRRSIRSADLHFRRSTRRPTSIASRCADVVVLRDKVDLRGYDETIPAETTCQDVVVADQLSVWTPVNA